MEDAPTMEEYESKLNSKEKEIEFLKEFEEQCEKTLKSLGIIIKDIELPDELDSLANDGDDLVMKIKWIAEKYQETKV